MTDLKSFEKLSNLYVARYMRPAWEENVGFEKDPWLSLRLFLKMYAFERQGRSPDYAFVAVDAIDKNRSAPLEPASSRTVWRSFTSRLRKKLNHANNPLCPQGTTYFRFYKKAKRKSNVKKISVIQLAGELDRPLVVWARDRLQGGSVSDAYAQIRRINGVSDKIASFFLRDVASRFQLAPAQDRYLLQPIDVWIRFVVHKVCQDGQLKDDQCAKWIVEKSGKPECLNQGIWYFCANIAHSSQYLVLRALQERKFFNELVTEHLTGLRRAAGSADAYESQA